MPKQYIIYGDIPPEPTITPVGWVILAVLAAVTILCYAIAFAQRRKNPKRLFLQLYLLLALCWLAFVLMPLLPCTPKAFIDAIPAHIYIWTCTGAWLPMTFWLAFRLKDVQSKGS